MTLKKEVFSLKSRTKNSPLGRMLEAWSITLQTTPSTNPVTNSRVNNNGSSLNNCTFKGPNQLASIHKLLLKFRMYKHGFSYDHMLQTGPVEKFLRLLVWRYNENEPWITFAFICMTSLLGDSVLGYLWFTQEDMMAVKLWVNLSKKCRKLSKYPDFDASSIKDIRKVKLTFRKTLSLISTQYDPLGMVSCWGVYVQGRLQENESS